MKRKITQAALIAVLIINSTVWGFAGTRLERPYIDTVKPAKSSIKLDWDAVRGADSYKVYRSASSGGTYRYIGSSSASWYQDKKIKPGTRYYYKVRAVAKAGRENSYLSSWRSGRVKKASASASGSPAVSQGIYITKTGTKYHRAGCRYLRKSAIKKTLSYVKSRGFTPCAVCW